MSQVEENHFTKEIVSKADQHRKEIETAMIQVAREKKPRTEKTKRPEMLKTHKKPLGKQQVIHPHQSSDHIFSEKVKGSARRKKMRNNNTVNAIDDLNRPKTCAVGCIEIPNAKEAEPRTFGHNHNQTSVAEIDLALRKASKRELHKEPTAVNRGPAKIVSNDSKPLHCVMRGDPLIIDNDDTYINKPNTQEMELEDLTCIRDNQQLLIRPAVPDRHGREREKETTKPLHWTQAMPQPPNTTTIRTRLIQMLKKLFFTTPYCQVREANSKPL